MTSPEWTILRMDSQTAKGFNEELAGLFGRINEEYEITYFILFEMIIRNHTTG